MSTKITGIYKIISPTNKIYIGQSIDILNRIRYYKHPNSCRQQFKLQNSINKYGWDKHKFEIIEECDIKILNERERYWQDYYNSFKNGLNCRLTTSNDKSGKVSQETKNKTRNKLLGHEVLQTTKNKIGLANSGRTVTTETRNKISKNNGRGTAKLSDMEVHDICQMLVSEKTTQEIKEKYPNLHSCTLSEIRTKKIFTYITNLYNIKKEILNTCNQK